MLLGMTGSMTIGTVFGIWLPHQLAVSTILSIVISAGIAVLIGAGFGLNGHIEAQASSLMGSVMGAMLGVMLLPNEQIIMIIAMDALYLISLFFTTFILEKDASIKGKIHLKGKLLSILYAISLLIICIAGTLEITHINPEEEKEPAVSHHEHEHEH